ncbi:MAG: hypothetical protein ABSD75_19795 [Terriglobales bacterium]
MKPTSTAGDKFAALKKELDTIHSANVLYWKRGTDNSHQARAEYQRRLDRVDEIRKELEQALCAAFEHIRCA